ncbi:MAG: macro domain-containing protein [bacterium]
MTSGDIASQDDVEAVVNAANAQLRPGGGVAGAIHRTAGPGLDRECRLLAPIRPGEAVITSAHDLPNEYVIHCLGPVFGRDEPSDQLLNDCYRNALLLAEKHGIRSVAFPSISTGIFGYPMQDAAEVALKAVVESSPSLECVIEVRFVLFGEEALRIHEAALSNYRTRARG